MTRQEERDQAAKEYCESVNRYSEEGFAFGDFTKGAKWADKTMLDKVCDYIDKYLDGVPQVYKDFFNECMRKALQ